jgi:hypothetical protein
MEANNLLTKSLLFALGFCICLFVYYYLSTEARLDKLRDQKELKIEAERISHQKAIDSLQREFITETEKLRNDLNQLVEYSDNLTKQIRRYEKRPDFDLDFLSAADIISKSKYRSGQ